MKHGHASNGKYSSTYVVWQGMLRRCRNPNCREFKYYGGRGIAVCKAWHKFENFLADMGERPPSLTLDRINNDGNYEPDNCRWATMTQQLRNSRLAKKITFLGKTHTVREWEISLGLCQGALAHRIRKGWALDKALTVSKMHTGKP